MSSQIPGIPAAGSSGVAGTSPAGRVAPSRALVPVAPTEARPANPLSGTPLGRSGLDLGELLGTTDTVTARLRTPSVALEVGLEQARGALLRNLAGDALAALDNVWEGARRTEEGWYLRGSALTVLGLPGESDRIAQEGLEARPASTALRFLQSLARLAVGDAAGARAALQPALHHAPHEPLLMVQQAIVQARQGDSQGAELLLQRAMRASPEHPAIDYGRGAVRAAIADATRSVSRATPPLVQTMTDAAANALGEMRPDLRAGSRSEAGGVERQDRLGAERAGDVVEGALQRFGARLARGDVRDLAREGRLLMRAFSAGGTLVAACSADQAHAARVVLTTATGVLLGEPGDGTQPLRPLVQQLVAALRDGRTVDAERVLRRAGVVAREPEVRLLHQIVRGAVSEHAFGAGATSVGMQDAAVLDSGLPGAGPPGHRVPAAAGPTATPAEPFAGSFATRSVADGLAHDGVTMPSEARVSVQGTSEPGPLVPVRLGLALLTETTEQRLAARGFVPLGAMSGQPAVSWRNEAPSLLDQVTGSYRVVPDPDDVAAGWGAAQATAALQGAPRGDDLRAGAGVRAVALLCVGLAAAAMSTGHSVVAIALGIGAAWLALRRSNGNSGARHIDTRGDRDSVHEAGHRR